MIRHLFVATMLPVSHSPRVYAQSLAVGSALRAAKERYEQNGYGVGDKYFVCQSAGKCEKELQAYLKQRAEGG